MNFNLICNVKRKVNPLTLNVKAEGYATNVEVKFKDSSGTNVVLTPNQINTINFYEVRAYSGLYFALSPGPERLHKQTFTVSLT